MRLVTGNDLASGDVVWWTGTDWSRHLSQAADAAAEAEAIAAREAAAQRVNVPYVVDAEASADGPRPLHIKDRIRGAGPTVRADLGVRPLDAERGEWVI